MKAVPSQNLPKRIPIKLRAKEFISWSEHRKTKHKTLPKESPEVKYSEIADTGSELNTVLLPNILTGE